jgi:hypothetical protein
MAYSFGRRSLFLAFDFANGFNQPFLPDGLTGWPRVRLASLPHGLKNNIQHFRLFILSTE